MLEIYNQFQDFHVFKKFKYLFGEWWNMDFFVIIKEGEQFFYDNKEKLNNSLVKDFLESPLFKNYFLSSVKQSANEQMESHDFSKSFSWKQTGLNFFVIPVDLKNKSSKAFLVATGFAPEKEKQLYQSLTFLGFSQKVTEQKINTLKKLSSTDKIYIQKMLVILVEEFVTLLQTQKKKEETLQKQNQAQKNSNFQIGKAPAMVYIHSLLSKIRNYDAVVLIEGETGTGKELLAERIHKQSLRSKQKFYSQNCSSFKGYLLDLNVFGYTKGAFPKAYKNKQGLLEKLDGGTLFFNEIGDTSLDFQKKVLRFLKQGVFFVEGDSKPRKSNVRILFSTCRNLKSLVKEKVFLKELYFSMNVINIKMPPLNKRKEDLPILVEYFLNQENEAKKRTISAQAMKAFYNYSWPGNIQELESEIHKMLSLASNGQNLFTEQDISPHIRRASSSLSTMFQVGQQNLKGVLRSIEKQILIESLQKTNWNKSRTAKLLGTSRTSIILKTKEYGLIKKEGA